MTTSGTSNDIGQAVRPKSSRRKGRSATIQREARTPTQARSRHRYETVLEATEKLLQTANIEDISFYDIAQVAGITPPSVHYLFPSMAAVQLELSRRYNERVSNLLVDFHEKLSSMRIPIWQEWIRIEANEARNFYNRNRPVCEIVLGPLLHREARVAIQRGNVQVGASNLENLRRIFDVPKLPDLEEKFAYNCELIEMFWSASYMANGWIDDKAFEESIRASIGYLRNFLPEQLPLLPQEGEVGGLADTSASPDGARSGA